MPCIVTSFTMNSLQNRAYGIANPLLSWSLIGNYVTVQVPACGYAVHLNSSGEPNTFVNVTQGTTLTYTAFTRDLAEKGDNNITVSASLNSYSLGLHQT